MDVKDDWSWQAWPKASRVRHVALALALALALVATGSGLTFALRALVARPAASRGALPSSAASLVGAPLATLKITRQLDPAIVDVNTVAESAGGPSNVAGTGMIVSPDGLIVTNNHVVEDAVSIKVSIAGHPGSYPAGFVGADPAADVALLKVGGFSHLPTVPFAAPSRLTVGESVLAIGNSLGLGGTPSVTTGVISALDRTITATSETGADAEHLSDMIQADSPIAPGNSGGPLVDGAGRVIGMNTAAASGGPKTDTSVAFAIPIGKVAAVLRRIEAGRAGSGVVIGRGAYLGIEGLTVSLVGQQQSSAVNIVQVEPGTPAARLGLEPGDLILRLGGVRTGSIGALSGLIAGYPPGTEVSITFEAGGVQRTSEVRLVAGPAA